MSRARSTIRWAARGVRRRAEIVLVERRYVFPASLMSDLGDHDALAEGRNAYAPSPWRLLSHMLPPGEVDSDDVFADFGCGKGRVLLEAAERYPFRRLIGVEAEPHLADAARALLLENQTRLASCRWEVVTADVRDYEVPDEVTVAYFFDPFTGPLFAAAISRLEASLERCPRTVRIVYLVPREIERLVRGGNVRPVRRGTAGWLRTGGRYEYFVGDLLPTASA